MSARFTTFASPDPMPLAVGPDPLSRKVTLAAGQVLPAGAVLGRITLGAPTAAKVSGAGDGAIGAVTLGPAAWTGVYRLVCTAAAEDAGTFAVFAPTGERLADLTVGVAYAGPHLNLTVAPGTTDWGAGAVVEVTVPAGSDKYVLATAAAVDGSQIPDAVLAEAAGSATADAEALAFVRADVLEPALVLGAGHTLDTVRHPLRHHGIHLIPALTGA